MTAPAGQGRAILCVLGSGVAFSAAAALVKAIGHDIPVVETVLFRSFVALLVLLPLLRRQGGWAALRTRAPFGHVLRTLLGFVGMATSFYGYAVLPLATVTALNFAMPLCLAALAVPLLGERVGPVRLAALVLGFAGVLLILRPWAARSEALRLDALLVVLAGVVAWALAMITIRRMGARGERNVAIVLWFSFGSTVLAAFLAAPAWVWPAGWQWPALIGVGAISALAQMLMTEGYRSGETTLVAPFEYAAILHTTALGALFWGEWPGSWTFLGVAVLVAAGLLIWRQEAAASGALAWRPWQQRGPARRRPS